MNKNKLFSLGQVNQTIWEDVKRVHDFMVKKSDFLDENHSLKEIGAVACVDDDIMSAIAAAMMYHYAVAQGMRNINVYCIGGKGLLSKHLKEKGERNYTEGKRLAHVCESLGVPKENLVVIDEGTNTGANIKALANHIATLPEDQQNENILFCLTQRLSLRFERTFKLQFYEQMMENGINCLAKDYYYVLKQDISDVCCWANGKAACNGRMFIHEIASIYNRCIMYANKFPLPLNFEVPLEIKESAFALEKSYGLKLGRRGLMELGQYFFLLGDLKSHLKEMKEEQQEAINLFYNLIKNGRYINWLMSHFL